MKIHLSLFALIILFSPVYHAQSQILEQLPQSPSRGSGSLFGGGAYYNFSSGSGCDIKVSIWGYVRNPGRYNIPCETNLLELLSFAGGPMEGAQLDRLMIVRRGGAEKPTELKEVTILDLQKYLKATNVSTAATDLLLIPGDLVVVDGEYIVHGDNFLRVMQAIVAVTSIVTGVVAVINVIRK